MVDQPDVSALLALLEAERAEIDVTIAHLRRRLGMPAASPDVPAAGVPSGATVGRDSPVTGRVRPDEFFRLSIADAIVRYLNIMKQPQSPMTIVSGLKAGGVLTQAKNFYANVNTELKRMKKRGLVVNTKSGWGLAEWYPSKPKQGEIAKPKRKKRRGPAKTGSGTVALNPDKMNWHQFLGASAKAGKTMEQAAAEWKQRKAANA